MPSTKMYSKLYEPRQSSDVNLDGLLNYNDIPKLTHNMSEMLEGPLTDVEVYNVLKTMKNN